jgi:hypothetical protein
MRNARRDKELADEKTASDKKLAILKDEHARKIISDREYERRQAALEKEAAERQQALRDEYGKKAKRAAIAQIWLNFAVQEAQILTNALNPLNPANALTFGSAGFIAAAVETATALASAVAQTALVSRQKYSMGGIITGPTHAAGGVPLHEAQGGEVILHENVSRYPDLLWRASELNVAAGGARLAATPSFAPASPFVPNHSGTASPISGQSNEVGKSVEVYQVLGNLSKKQRQRMRTVSNNNG